jgi:hypothetical protein|tara:strand:+ start:3574 stop:4308 length:735 start_codon:yes stop_codon:yes gene_type:complete
MAERINPFPPGSKLRPDAILPDFEIYLKNGPEYVKQETCTATGESVQGNIKSGSARVPLASKNLHIMLPNHRIFLSLDKNKNFVPICGLVTIPTIKGYEGMRQVSMKPDSIFEVDKQYVTVTSHYRWTKDINHKLVPPATYLFVGQLALYRGANVTTVGYLEHEACGPLLRKITTLSPWYGKLEQAYAHVQRNPQDPQQLNYVGRTVLKHASMINYSNRHLVDTSTASFKYKKPFKRFKKHVNK